MKQEEVFNKIYSEYYNLFYADKNYSQEVEYVNNVIKNHHPEGQSILEYGSGTGGHGLLLKNKGYEIYGIERSENMANIAVQRGYPCQVGDITNFSLSRKFDVCVALFHVVSYITTNLQLATLFQNTQKHLSSGGIFIFDVWFTPAVYYQVPEVRVKEIENEKLEIIRIAKPVLHDLNNTVTVNYQIFMKDKQDGSFQQFKESHVMRHFGFQEIAMLAESNGFSVVKAEEFLTGKEPSVTTWGVNFILRVK